MSLDEWPGIGKQTFQTLPQRLFLLNAFAAPGRFASSGGTAAPTPSPGAWLECELAVLGEERTKSKCKENFGAATVVICPGCFHALAPS